jgi:hypothetical protein
MTHTLDVPIYVAIKGLEKDFRCFKEVKTN